MTFWQSIHEELKAHQQLALLYVLWSEGSSPGRQGFKMLVAKDGWMAGSIGGGAMEYKLVEMAKMLLAKGSFQPFIKKQIHRRNETQNRSGMICSGEQMVGFYYLNTSDDEHWSARLKHRGPKSNFRILLHEKGIELLDGKENSPPFLFEFPSENSWSMVECPENKPTLYIIGAGHVGLAFSQLMHELDFHVVVLDDRPALNTFIENRYADEKRIVDYAKIERYIPDDPDIYICLMSFGYRTDKLVITRLLNKPCKYFGVLGSQSKMEKLMEELNNEGFNADDLNRIFTPIGLRIHSKTPMEIAVSIAAQIIQLKNSPF